MAGVRSTLATSLRTLTAVAIAAAGLVAVTATPAAAAPSWSIVSSPSPAGPTHDELDGVVCTSATNCLAVGHAGWLTLGERWNGSSWSQVPTPEPDWTFGQSPAYLSDIGCTTASNCFAVGYGEPDSAGPLVERWNGHAWSNVAPPGSGSGASLNGIACPGPSTCHAVGGDGTSLFATRWNGASWTTVTIAAPSGAHNAALSHVACASTTNCIAVGSYQDANLVSRTLTERWNGTKWTVVASPNPAGAKSSSLSGIACPAASSCYAVGTYTAQNKQQRTLAERWNGTKWAIVSSPSPSGHPALLSVACRSASTCTAVGTAGKSTLIERWTGTKWAIVSSPSPSGAKSSALHAVSCPTASACFAVGNGVFASNPANSRVFNERWNGTKWSAQTSPVGASVSPLDSVACASSTFCVAAGSYEPLGPPTIRPFLEQWNGTVWTTTLPPVPSGSTASTFDHVACVSTMFCVAVGDATIGSQQTLIEQWNGTSWSVEPGAVAGSLAGVACTDAMHCVAVGTSGGQTLVEQWDGMSWTTASGAVSGSLNSVSCADASNCMAVGVINLPNSPVLQWNGASWTAIDGPVPGGDGNSEITPTGVSCSAAADCMMVGHYRNFFGYAFAYAGHWDGTAWTTVSMPSSGFGSLPADVSCASRTDCTAVGYSFPNHGTEITLVEHWDGSSWSIVTSPNPPTASPPGSVLAGVTCTGAGACFAVGSFIANANTRTLIERYA